MKKLKLTGIAVFFIIAGLVLIGCPETTDDPPVTKTYTVSGTITCEDSGDGIANASVKLMKGVSTVKSTTTDADGKYSFSEVTEGTYDIDVAKLGYISKLIDNVLVKGNLTGIDAAMEKATSFTVTVVNGIIGASGSVTTGEYPEGIAVTVTANAPASGQVFKVWTADKAVIITDVYSSTTTFIMISSEVTITATYETGYDLTVVDGIIGTSGTTATGKFWAGATVTITAAVPTEPNEFFREWTADKAVTFDNVNGSTTTLTMPAEAVTITANFDTGFRVNITGGTSDFEWYATGSEVTITATVNAELNEELVLWKSGDVTFTNAHSHSTTFIMPASDVTITTKTLYRFKRIHLKTLHGGGLWTTGNGGPNNDETIDYQALLGNEGTFFVEDSGYLALGPEDGYQDWILMTNKPNQPVTMESFTEMDEFIPNEEHILVWRMAFKNETTGNFINVQDIIDSIGTCSVTFHSKEHNGEVTCGYTSITNAVNGSQVKVSPFRDEPGFYWGASATVFEEANPYGINHLSLYNGDIQLWDTGFPGDHFGILSVLGDFANQMLKPSHSNKDGYYAVQFLGNQTEMYALGANFQPKYSFNYQGYGPNYHAVYDIIWRE